MRPNLALRRGNYKNAPRSVDLVSYDQVMCLLSELGTLYMYNKPFLSSSQEEDKMTYSNISVLQFLSVIHECHRIIISRAADQLKSFYYLIL